MRKFILFIAILAIAALAAVFTKPSPQDVEAKLKAQFLDKLADTNPSASGEGGAFALTLMCKADQDACWQVVRQGLKVGYEDRRLYAAVALKGYGEEVSCYGAFTRLYCRNDIPVPQP